MKFKLNLINKIILGCIVLILIPLILMGYRLYHSSSQLIEGELRAVSASRIDAYNAYYLNEINSNLVLFLKIWDENETLTSAIGNSVLEKSFRQDWASALKGYPEVLSVYYGDSEGAFLNYPEFDLSPDYDPRLRGWYIEAIAKPNEIIWTEPYVDVMTKKLVVTLAKAQKKDNAIDGVLAIDVTLDDLSEFLDEAQLSETGYLYLVSQNGNIIGGPDPSIYGKHISEFKWGQWVLDVKMGSITSQLDGIKVTISHITNEISGWKLIGIVPEKDYKKGFIPFSKLLNKIFLVVAIWTLVLISLVILYSRKVIVKPIQKVMHYMSDAEAGDLRLDHIHLEKRTDEIGQLLISFKRMIEGQRDLLVSVLDTATQLEGTVHQTGVVVKLSSENAESQSVAMGDLFSNLDEMSQSITEVTNNMQLIAENLDRFTYSMQDVGRASNEVAMNTVETAESISDVSSALKQLDETIQAIHGHVIDANSQGKVVSVVVEEGSLVVEETKAKMDVTQKNMSNLVESIYMLGNSADAISEIIEFIEDITEQTTLLALNASIEAARAGEQGKGFAVVANAIGRLSEKAKASTKDVDLLIRTIQKQVSNASDKTESSAEAIDQSVALMNKTEKAFHQINASISNTINQIEQIASNASDEVESSQQIMLAAEKVGDLTMEVSASTEEQVATFNELIENLETMNQLTQEVSLKGVMQAKNSEEIAKTGKDLNAMTFDLSAISEDVEIISKELDTQAKQLVKLVSKFKL